MTEVAQITKEGKKTLYLEQSDEHYMTVKTKNKNKNFEVDVYLFSPQQLEELRIHQERIMKKIEDKQSKELKNADIPFGGLFNKIKGLLNLTH